MRSNRFDTAGYIPSPMGNVYLFEDDECRRYINDELQTEGYTLNSTHIKYNFKISVDKARGM
jgi:hypothetical protein